MMSKGGAHRYRRTPKRLGLIAPLSVFLMIGAAIISYQMSQQQDQLKTVATQAKSVAGPIAEICNGTDAEAAITLDRQGLCGRAAEVISNPVVASPEAAPGSVITTQTVTVSPAPIEVTRPGQPPETVTRTETPAPPPAATVTSTAPAPPPQTNTVTRTEQAPPVTQTQTQVQTQTQTATETATVTQTVQSPPETVTQTQQVPVDTGNGDGGNVGNDNGGASMTEDPPLPGLTSIPEPTKSNLFPGVPLLGSGSQEEKVGRN